MLCVSHCPPGKTTLMLIFTQVGVEEHHASEERDSTGTDWKAVLDAPNPEGSTAKFDPYEHTVRGTLDCPYFRRIRGSGKFIVPEEMLSAQEQAKKPLFITLQGLPGAKVPSTAKRPKTVRF